MTNVHDRLLKMGTCWNIQNPVLRFKVRGIRFKEWRIAGIKKKGQEELSEYLVTQLSFQPWLCIESSLEDRRGR